MERFVHPDEFAEFKKLGEEDGIQARGVGAAGAIFVSRVRAGRIRAGIGAQVCSGFRWDFALAAPKGRRYIVRLIHLIVANRAFAKSCTRLAQDTSQQD